MLGEAAGAARAEGRAEGRSRRIGESGGAAGKVGAAASGVGAGGGAVGVAGGAAGGVAGGASGVGGAAMCELVQGAGKGGAPVRAVTGEAIMLDPAGAVLAGATKGAGVGIPATLLAPMRSCVICDSAVAAGTARARMGASKGDGMGAWKTAVGVWRRGEGAEEEEAAGSKPKRARSASGSAFQIVPRSFSLSALRRIGGSSGRCSWQKTRKALWFLLVSTLYWARSAAGRAFHIRPRSVSRSPLRRPGGSSGRCSWLNVW